MRRCSSSPGSSRVAPADGERVGRAALRFDAGGVVGLVVHHPVVAVAVDGDGEAGVVQPQRADGVARSSRPTGAAAASTSSSTAMYSWSRTYMRSNSRSACERLAEARVPADDGRHRLLLGVDGEHARETVLVEREVLVCGATERHVSVAAQLAVVAARRRRPATRLVNVVPWMACGEQVDAAAGASRRRT